MLEKAKNRILRKNRIFQKKKIAQKEEEKKGCRSKSTFRQLSIHIKTLTRTYSAMHAVLKPKQKY